MLRKFSSVLDLVLSVRLLSSCTSDLHAGITCLKSSLSFMLLLDVVVGVSCVCFVTCGVVVVTGLLGSLGFVPVRCSIQEG